MQIVLAHVYKKRALNDNVGPYEARVKIVINFIIYIISYYKVRVLYDRNKYATGKNLFSKLNFEWEKKWFTICFHILVKYMWKNYAYK